MINRERCLPHLDVLSLYVGPETRWAEPSWRIADVLAQAVSLGCTRLKLIVVTDGVTPSLAVSIASTAHTCGLAVDVRAPLRCYSGGTSLADMLPWDTTEICVDGENMRTTEFPYLDMPSHRSVFVAASYTRFDRGQIISLVDHFCRHASIRVKLLAKCHSRTASAGPSMSVGDYIRFGELVSSLSSERSGRVWGLLPWVMLPQSGIAVSRQKCQFTNSVSSATTVRIYVLRTHGLCIETSSDRIHPVRN